MDLCWLQERALKLLPGEITILHIPLCGQDLEGPAEEGEPLHEKDDEDVQELRRGSGREPALWQGGDAVEGSYS